MQGRESRDSGFETCSSRVCGTQAAPLWPLTPWLIQLNGLGIPLVLLASELRFTSLSLPSRRTIYGPDGVASSYSAALGAGRAGPRLRRRRAAADSSRGAGPPSSEYHGGLVLRHRRWTGPASLFAGWADSESDVTCNCADPLIRPAAHVPWVLTESRDIGSGGADRGSVRNGRCAECDVTSIIFSCSHYYTAPVRTL